MHPAYTHIKQELSLFYTETEAAAISKTILTDVFGMSVVELYAGKDMNFLSDNPDKLSDIISRLKNHEPLQYILGETCFCGLTFEVSPSVLIPRPETAELVDWIVSDCHKPSVSILDIGTGSGCIPVSLSYKLNNLSPEVYAWDISDAALEVARRNASRNKVNVDFYKVDILGDSIPTIKVDVIVSNPPYISHSEKKTMERNVLDWEPELALFVPDTDPLIFYRRIAILGLNILNESGSLYFEINQLYGVETVEMLKSLGYKQIEIRKDMSSNDRMIKAIRP